MRTFRVSRELKESVADLADVENKDIGVVDNVYAAAIRDFRKTQKQKEEANKVRDAEKLDEKPKKPEMNKGAKQMKLEKLTLEESLFESKEEDIEKIQGQYLEFPNGDYLTVAYENGKLIAGSATNSGIFHDFEIEYDDDFSLDWNLQALYDKIIEEKPELLGEFEENLKKKPCKQESIKTRRGARRLGGLREDIEEQGEYDLNTNVTGILDAGQYNSAYLDLPEEAKETDENNKIWDNFIIETAKPYIEDATHLLDDSIQVSNYKYFHPKYYNYGTDEIEFIVKIDPQRLEQLKEEFANNQEFISYLKEFQSRDGFISRLAADLDEFKEQENWKSLAQMIHFVANKDYDKRNSDFHEDVYYEGSPYELGMEIEEEIEENLKEDVEKCYIKYWRDEVARDQGDSDIYETGLDKEHAIDIAKRLVDRGNAASVEVLKSPSEEIETEDDIVVFGYDGVETWGEESELKESIWNTDADTENVKHLSKEEIEKLYDKYEIEEKETITDAYYEDGKLHVIIVNEKGETTDYQPTEESLKESKEEPQHISPEEASKHVLDEKGRITVLGHNGYLGCDFYSKDGKIYAYNFELGPVGPKEESFDLLAHLKNLEDAGFSFIKSDDLSDKERTDLHVNNTYKLESIQESVNEDAASKVIGESKQLNEGAGAGYTIEGELHDIVVNKINNIEIRDGETAFGTPAKFARIDLDADALFDGTAESYYYGDTLDDAKVKITSIDVNPNLIYDLGLNEFEYDKVELVDLNDRLGFGSTLKFKSDVIGGGWSHATFDGKAKSSRVDDDYKAYIDGIEFEFVEPSDVEFIDKAVQGETEIEEE